MKFRRRDQRSWAAAGQVWIVLTFLVPLLWLPSALGNFTAPMVLTKLVVAYSAYRLAEVFSAPEPRVVQLFYWAFVYVWLGLAPMAQINSHIFPIVGSEYSESEEVASLLLVLIGLLAYDVGTFLARSRKRDATPDSRPDRKGFQRSIAPSRVVPLAVIALGLSIYFGREAGGLHSLFGSRDDVVIALRRYSSSDQSSLVVRAALLTVPAFLALYFIAFMRKADGERAPGAAKRTSPFLSPLVVVLLVANIAVNNPISTSRYWAGCVIFGFWTIVLPLTTMRRLRWVMIVLLLYAIAVFPYADAFRHSNSANVTLRPVATTFETKGDYDAFQQIMNGYRYVESSGFTLGKQLLGVALLWVPRSVWHGKPPDTAILIARAQGYSFQNLSAPVWIESYIDFGLIGLIGILLMIGWASQHLDEAHAKSGGSRQMLGAMTPILAAYQLIVLRGSLIQACGRLLLMVLIALCCVEARPRRLSPVVTRRVHQSARQLG